MLEVEHKQRFIQRSRMEIIANILTNALDGSRKTRLIYKCNLSLAQFNKYTDCLIEGDLLQKNIQKTRGRKSYEVYQATYKGKEFLKDYKRIGEILDKIS